MADYEPGKMDISNQVETYNSFWRWSLRIGIGSALLVLLVILVRT